MAICKNLVFRPFFSEVTILIDKMKLKKSVKITIGITTLWMIIYPIVFIAAMFGISVAPYRLDETSFPLFAAIVPLHCFTAILGMGLIIFYIIHAIKNTTASDVMRIVLLIGIFFMPFIAMPVYFLLYVWTDNPPGWALTTEMRTDEVSDLPGKPLLQQKWVRVLGGVAVILFAVIVVIVVSIVNYARPTGNVSYELDMGNLTGSEIEMDEGHFFEALTISPDGKILVIGTSKGFIYIRNLENGALLKSIRGHDMAIWGVDYSPDGMLLVSGADDEKIKIWDTSDWEILETIDTGGFITDVVFSPDGSKIASSINSREGSRVGLWDLSNGTLLESIPLLSYGVDSVAFSPDGELLALGGNRQIQIWKLTSRELVHSMPDIGLGDINVAFSPDGQTLVSGGEENAVKVWDVSTGSLKYKIKDTGFGSNPVIFPDGESFMVGVWRGRIKRYQMANGKTLETLKRPAFEVEVLALSPDGTKLVSAELRLIRVWEVDP